MSFVQSVLYDPNVLNFLKIYALNRYFLVSSIQLSPYNYERIEVVLKVMQAVDDNGASFNVSQVNACMHARAHTRK